jgi:sugar/nucleoside kinase (ribokinase family)
MEKLFSGVTQDLWDMMEELSQCCSEAVVVLDGFSGGYLFSKQPKKRYCFPTYPFSRKVNPLGCDEAFCGGYTAGQRQTYDPVDSIGYGCVSTSILLECTNPLTALKVLPELKLARLQAMRKLIKTV